MIWVYQHNTLWRIRGAYLGSRRILYCRLGLFSSAKIRVPNWILTNWQISVNLLQCPDSLFTHDGEAGLNLSLRDWDMNKVFFSRFSLEIFLLSIILASTLISTLGLFQKPSCGFWVEQSRDCAHTTINSELITHPPYVGLLPPLHNLSHLKRPLIRRIANHQSFNFIFHNL